MSANKLQLGNAENHRLLELALHQTSEMFDDCHSANEQVPLFRLKGECE
jgi:hypothetical protein